MLFSLCFQSLCFAQAHLKQFLAKVKPPACVLLHSLLAARYDFYNPTCECSLDPPCFVLMLPVLSLPCSSPALASCCIACSPRAFCLSHHCAWDMRIFSMVCWLCFCPSRACEIFMR